MTTESVAFRTRLQRALSQGGLSDRSVAAEVLLLLPAEFVDQYEQLYMRIWPIGSSVHVGDVNAESPTALKWRTSSNQTETRGTASPKGSGSTSKGLGVRDTRAAATKDWADRQLRKITREIKARMTDDGDDPTRRCSGAKCRRIADSTWNYCPNCGAPTQEED